MFDRLNIYAVNIVGNVLKSMTRMISFIAEDAYYRAVGQTVSTFVSELDVEEDSILGVGVAIQGIISFDGERLVYSGILNNSDITREDFARYLKWPCYLFHDSDSAGYAESRYDKNIAKAAYIYLNPYFGSTMILDGKVIQDEDISSGIFAHMCLYPGGKQCYCGKKGCVDAYCSAKALERESGEETEVFFEKLRKGGKHEKAVWKKYLQNLAIVINNIRMVINCDFVIGGKLERYMIDEDYERIKEYTGPDYTAIFAMSDTMAIGAARALMDSGKRVPEDVSVIGYDGIELAQYYHPALATMRQPQQELADRSVELLLESMDTDCAPKHIQLETELIQGASVKHIS